MDLVGAESRKTGTRGGRGSFTWEAVREEERSYYLGASVGKPVKSRRGGFEGDWYLKPISTPNTAGNSSSLPPFSREKHTQGPLVTDVKAAPVTRRVTGVYAEVKAGAEAEIEGDGEGDEEADLVRRREKAIMARMLNGRASTFAEAVRSALTESVGSGVGIEDTEDGVASGAGVNSGGSIEVSGSGNAGPGCGVPRRDTRAEAHLREKRDRAVRKEMRRRVRESRLARRVERSRYGMSNGRGANVSGGGGSGGLGTGNGVGNVNQNDCLSLGTEIGTSVPITITSGAGLLDGRVVQDDSSDSQREAATGRPLEGRRRRRRRDRDSAPRRKRSDWSSTSESDDFDRHRSRRRLR